MAVAAANTSKANSGSAACRGITFIGPSVGQRFGDERRNRDFCGFRPLDRPGWPLSRLLRSALPQEDAELASFSIENATDWLPASLYFTSLGWSEFDFPLLAGCGD